MVVRQKRRLFAIRQFNRALRVEGLEQRLPMAVDLDDSLSEATSLGTISTTPATVNAGITPDDDVDMYRFTVAAGQVVDFDIDTPQNGAGGLGSFLRLFGPQGQQLAFNDDAIAPGENVIGFDAYLRFTFATAGTFYMGVSNFNNTIYDAVTGNGDTTGGQHATGNYQLIVQALPVDTDDSLSEAISLGAISATPITVNGRISTDIDVDMYRFTVAAGQTVDFDIDTPFNGPAGLGSFIRLFSAQGQHLAFNNDAAAPGETTVGFDSYLQFTFATAGAYFLGVSNFNNARYNPITGDGDTAGGRFSIGDYQLIVQAPAAPPTDADDTLAEAAFLGAITTTPVTINGGITPSVDVDMYRFTVTAGQVVDFDIDTSFNGPGGLGSFLRLFNQQGQELAFNDDAIAPGENIVGFDAYLRFTFTTAGTFYIGVSNWNNTLYNPTTGTGDTAAGQHATGSYQLIVQALPVDTDDTISEAILIGAISATPTTVNGRISTDIDVDMYRFTVSAGQVVDFDIDTPFNGPAGLGSFIRLFNAQGQLLAFNNDAAAPGEGGVGFDSYLQFTFATAGTYYLGVSNFNNARYNPLTGEGDTAGGRFSIGNYQLIVQTPSAPPTDTDDSLPEAAFLGAITTTPVTINGGISPDVDVDIYRFTVTAGQVVDFDIDTSFNGPGGLGSFLRLFNAQGQEIEFNDDGTAPGENVLGFDAYLRFTFATSGTYYIGVSNWNNTLYNPLTGTGDAPGGLHATGSYQLIVQALPVDTDDALPEAVFLGAISSTAAIVNASITPDIDVDMYRFTASGGQVIEFDIDTPQNGPGGLGSFLRLFTGQGQQIAFNDDAAAPGETIGFDAYLRITFAANGTYYIGVSNANNRLYHPITGNGDQAGGLHSIGGYQLIVRSVPPGIAPFATTNSASSAPRTNDTSSIEMTPSSAPPAVAAEPVETETTEAGAADAGDRLRPVTSIPSRARAKLSAEWFDKYYAELGSQP